MYVVHFNESSRIEKPKVRCGMLIELHLLIHDMFSQPK